MRGLAWRAGRMDEQARGWGGGVFRECPATSQQGGRPARCAAHDGCAAIAGRPCRWPAGRQGLARPVQCPKPASPAGRARGRCCGHVLACLLVEAVGLVAGQEAAVHHGARAGPVAAAQGRVRGPPHLHVVQLGGTRGCGGTVGGGLQRCRQGYNPDRRACHMVCALHGPGGRGSEAGCPPPAMVSATTVMPRRAAAAARPPMLAA